jgi:CRISPR system Cascade subunit CasD
MTTLLLRLEGPMQSWGTQSRFRDRDTGLEPSKSGVIGLLCAALGRPRAADVGDLAGLRFGVRADRPGTMRMDFQTAGANYPRYNQRGQMIGRTTGILSPRYFLADASFLVGLEGDAELLRAVDRAVESPRWQLYLGRKAFPPARQLRLPEGLQDEELSATLRSYPREGGGARVRIVVDDPEGSEVRNDVPLSFAARRYAVRRVTTIWTEVPS